ncbi:uncharacterized protein LOC122627279 [Vespula pensylvanica]|uniref:uncharacterized protein LOC122627279 n=1 Tax=Vespula pensylvanica TaxID=30213 RepID=UPI001CBA25E8|nr:uncharacterized protein LOC122627279 [Vespula pensylvanica]
MVIDFTFVFWIRYIKIKFGQLNAVLQNMLTTTIDFPQHKRVLRMKDNWEDDSLLSTIYHMYKGNENLVKLKRIKEVHLELIKCARNINDAYGLHILLSITTAFILIITVAYDAYFLHVTNAGDILCELYEPSTSKEFRAEIRHFILQLIQNPLSFTTCGLFYLDYTLIRNVIGTVITYLVILIQIGNVSIQTFVKNSTFTANDL